MDNRQLKVYAGIQSCTARMEGMKARNALALAQGDQPFWNQQDFDWLSDELDQLSASLGSLDSVALLSASLSGTSEADRDRANAIVIALSTMTKPKEAT